MAAIESKQSPDGKGKLLKNVADLIKKNNIQVVDLKFNDLPGLWQHFSIPADDVIDDM